MRMRKAQDFHVGIRKHFRSLDPSVKFDYEVPCGNIRLDMVATYAVNGNQVKAAVEIKGRRDDVQRGFAELAIAKAYGYDQCILVTTKRNTSKLDPKPFQYYGFNLAYMNQEGKVILVKQVLRESERPPK